MKYFPSGIKFTSADIATILGFFASIIATFFIFEGWFLEAYGLILLQIIFDFVDGRIARKKGISHKLGAELDNFSDFYTLINSALLGFLSGMNHPLTLVILSLFIFAGALRLSIFSVVGTENGYFRGIPTTLTSFLMSTLVMINIWFVGIDPNWLLLGYAFFAILMPSGVRVKKV